MKKSLLNLNRTTVLNITGFYTLRKTFGKRVWEMDGQSERSLVYLSQIFNHSNVGITRRYIGIVQEDIRNIYLNL
jgi:integrase